MSAEAANIRRLLWGQKICFQNLVGTLTLELGFPSGCCSLGERWRKRIVKGEVTKREGLGPPSFRKHSQQHHEEVGAFSEEVSLRSKGSSVAQIMMQEREGNTARGKCLGRGRRGDAVLKWSGWPLTDRPNMLTGEARVHLCKWAGSVPGASLRKFLSECFYFFSAKEEVRMKNGENGWRFREKRWENDFLGTGEENCGSLAVWFWVFAATHLKCVPSRVQLGGSRHREGSF